MPKMPSPRHLDDAAFLGGWIEEKVEILRGHIFGEFICV